MERENKDGSSTSTQEVYTEISTVIRDEETSPDYTEETDNLELITFCHEMDEYQKAFGESCINVQRNLSNNLMSRDILLERLFQKAWLTFTV